MDNNNMFDRENQNGEQGQFQQQQPYQQGAYQQQSPYQGAYQQQPYQQGAYQQQSPYQQGPYQQQGDSGLEEPVTFADWMVSTLIMFIPCVNIIMMFVWAFGPNTKKSKSNYFKAALVWMAISVVLTIVMAGAFGAVFASLLESGLY